MVIKMFPQKRKPFHFVSLPPTYLTYFQKFSPPEERFKIEIQASYARNFPYLE